MSETRTAYRTCPLCEATCGLELTLDGDSVTRIRGDRDDVFSHGFICPKGSTLKQLHSDPDRLRTPQIREGDTWRPASWDEAFALIADRLGAIRADHGNDAVALYLGNPNVHNLAGGIYLRPLIKALGTVNLYSASTVDQMPRHVSCGLMFGNPGTIPVPDLDRTDHLLMLGANPFESNGSLCTAPDFPGRMAAIQKRGGRVVVVDPRRTRTAEAADEHLTITPGADALLLTAMINTLVTDGRVDPGPLGAHTDGLDDLAQLVEPFTPAAVADHCGIDAETIVRLADEVASAPSAAVYGRMGAHTVAFGTVASWAADVLALITGNLDQPGGLMFARPAHGRGGEETPGGRGFSIGRRRSRVRDLPEVRGELPVATLADEMLTPGPGQVRALITIAGNPARSTPDSGRLAEGLGGLEFVVSVDPYRNETSRFADVILPPPSALERPHYDLAFLGLTVRNVANYSPPVIPDPSVVTEEEILARLALIAAGEGPDADPAVIDELILGTLLGSAMNPDGVLAGRDEQDVRDALTAHDTPTEQILDLMVRVGPYGDHFGGVPDGLTLEQLKANPHGIDLGPLEPRLPGALDTESGRIDVAPSLIRGDLVRLADTLAGPPEPGLRLVGRRHLRSNNSWMHNVEVLVKGKERCTLQVNPDDAASLGLVDGGAARVTSRVGSVEAPVEVTDRVMAGVVCLPHGWGHDDPGAALGVASTRPGVNSNLLTDPAPLDALSGNAVLNGIGVDVAPA